MDVSTYHGHSGHRILDKGADREQTGRCGEWLRLGVRLLTTEGHSCSLGETRRQMNWLASRQASWQ